MPRPIAQIDLVALAENARLVRSRLPPGCGLMMVVKADAYGHGIAPISRAAEAAGVERFGVATIEEGRAIRAAGVTRPILLLDPTPPREVPFALAAGLELSVDSPAGARIASDAAVSGRNEARLHIDVDLGMARFGIKPSSARALIAKIARLPAVRVEGIFGHLPRADSDQAADQEETRHALTSFRDVLDELDRCGLLPPLRHVANSAAAIQYPDESSEAPFNLVRIGTLLYGYPEVPRPWTAALSPVASLSAEVIALREVESGTWIGYGRSWCAPSRRRIAILALGYADGLPPQFANRGRVLLHGREAPIVGQVCLDHTFVDVTEIAGVRPGDAALVFGPDRPADVAAAAAGLAVCELLVPTLRGVERRHE